MDTRKRETFTADTSITLLKPPLSARGILSTAEMSACAHRQWEASVRRGSEFPDSGELDL